MLYDLENALREFKFFFLIPHLKTPSCMSYMGLEADVPMDGPFIANTPKSQSSSK